MIVKEGLWFRVQIIKRPAAPHPPGKKATILQVYTLLEKDRRSLLQAVFYHDFVYNYIYLPIKQISK